MIRMFHFIQKTQDLNFLLLWGSGQIFGLILFYFISMVISFKIWQIIIFSSKFSLNWAISNVFLYFILFSTNGGWGQTLSGKFHIFVVVETMPYNTKQYSVHKQNYSLKKGNLKHYCNLL